MRKKPNKEERKTGTRKEENQKMNELKKCAVLIGAGDIGRQIPVITKNHYVIALDGGLVFCAENDITPNMIVGDFDSLPKERYELLAQYPEEIIVKLPCEKDDTDTLAAIKAAIKKGITDFTIYGGLGGRLSHTLANIQCLLYLKEHGLYGELVGDGVKVFLIKEESCVFPSEMSGWISVFSLSERAEGVIIKNLKYEVTDAVLDNTFPVGVSNEFLGKTAEIKVERGVLLIVIETKAYR